MSRPREVTCPICQYTVFENGAHICVPEPPGTIWVWGPMPEVDRAPIEPAIRKPTPWTKFTLEGKK